MLRNFALISLFLILSNLSAVADERGLTDFARLACFEVTDEKQHMNAGKLVVLDQMQVEGMDKDGTARTFYADEFLEMHNFSPALAFYVRVYDFFQETPQTEEGVRSIVNEGTSVTHLGIPERGMRFMGKKISSRFVAGHEVSDVETIVVQVTASSVASVKVHYGALRNQITRSSFNGITDLRCLDFHIASRN